MMAFTRFSFVAFLLTGVLGPQLLMAQGVYPKTRLLWFNGHWSPTNKNLFIIDKDSLTKGGGGTVTIKPKGEIQVNTPGDAEWNKKIDDALKSIDTWEKKLEDAASNTDLTSYHLNTLMKQDAEDSKQEWTGYKIDTKQDILGASNQQSQSSSTAEAPPAPDLGAYCSQIKGRYDELISYYEAHKADKDKDLQYPAPPQLDHSCYSCDSNTRKNYDTIIKHYVNDFFQPEYRLLRNTLEILHGFEMMGVRNDFTDRSTIMSEEKSALFDQDKKDPSKSGACSYVDFYKLYDAVFFYSMRGYWKAQKMFRDHRKDWKAAEAIISTVLEGARNVVLITGNSNLDDDAIRELPYLVGQAFDNYYGLLSHNDWSQVGNLIYIIGLARTELLLGSNSTRFDDALKQLIQIYNGFELTIEMDVKIGKDGGYHLAHIKGQCHVIPDFVRDSNQCYKWVVADEERKDVLGFPKSKNQQTINCNLLANEFVTQQGPRPTYIGTKKYIAALNRLHMDFCNPGKDTIVLSSFIPDPQENGMWQFPMSIKQNAGLMAAEQNFKSLDQMKELVNSGQAQQASDQMQAQAEKLKAQMTNVAAELKAGTNSLQNYQKIQELFQKSKDLANNASLAPMLFIDFELPVKNKDREIINQKFNAKEINPKLAEVIIYGYYTIHLENKANPKPMQPATPKK